MLTKTEPKNGAFGTGEKAGNPGRGGLVFAVLVSIVLLTSTGILDTGMGDEPYIYTDRPYIEYLNISADIDNNYAVTEIEEVLVNPFAYAVYGTFVFEMPEKAFISNFSLTIDGETYYAKIVSSEEGKEEFQEAVLNGTDAGLVESYGSNIFSYSISLSAYQKISVGLRYEEYIEKKLGGYEYVIPFSGAHYSYADSLSVDVSIKSRMAVIDVGVENYPDASTIWVSSNEARVGYYTMYSAPSEDFIVNYELGAPPTNGTLLNYKYDGTQYFMHIFSPQIGDLGGKSMPKDIIFVLDKSGSMSGEKIAQLKDAFSEIIGQLPEQDNFNIILFDSAITVYRDELLPASEGNKADAVSYINSIEAGGSTNINDAMITALNMFETSETRVPIIVMLTDGLPTSGITNTMAIRQNVLNNNTAGVSIFCLGFGFDVDFDFLKAMALENGGIAIRIYEGQDAGEQITDFYDTISTPLLRGLSFRYSEGACEIYPTYVDQMFDGTEVVVVGKYNGESDDITANVAATSWEGTVNFEETFVLSDNTGYDFIPRFWAYAKIRYLLDEIAVEGEVPSLVENVTSLALEYGFVTPYTSLLVKPLIDGGGSTETTVEEDTYADSSPSNSATAGAQASPIYTNSTRPLLSQGAPIPENSPDTLPTQSEGSSNLGSFSLLILLIVGTALAIIGYAKIQKYRLLEQERREMIYNYVQEHPGEHFRAIQRALGLEVGVLSHHLNKLEKGDYIRSRQDGIYRRFYPINSKIDMKMILSDVENRILTWIKRHPGSSQKEIANNLKLSRKVVNYHLKILRDAGFVRTVKDGRKILSYPNGEEF